MIKFIIAFLIITALMYPSRKEVAQESSKWDGHLAAGEQLNPEDLAKWSN